MLFGNKTAWVITLVIVIIAYSLGKFGNAEEAFYPYFGLGVLLMALPRQEAALCLERGALQPKYTWWSQAATVIGTIGCCIIFILGLYSITVSMNPGMLRDVIKIPLFPNIFLLLSFIFIALMLWSWDKTDWRGDNQHALILNEQGGVLCYPGEQLRCRVFKRNPKIALLRATIHHCVTLGNKTSAAGGYDVHLEARVDTAQARQLQVAHIDLTRFEEELKAWSDQVVPEMILNLRVKELLAFTCGTLLATTVIQNLPVSLHFVYMTPV